VLTIYPGGNIQGIYIPSGTASGPSPNVLPRVDAGARDVVGGLKGQKIWLSISNFSEQHALYLTGDFEASALKMTASLPGPGTKYFDSTKTVKVSN
jgi:hypothetical protein